MKIGFEIECTVSCKKYDEFKSLLPVNWELGTDASIREGRQSIGVEIKTEPMDNLSIFDWPDVKRVFKIMRVNQSTGLHIHISPDFFKMPDREKRLFVSNLVKIVYNNQSLLLKLTDKHRENNYYSKPLRKSRAVELKGKRTILTLMEKVYENQMNWQNGKRELKEALKGFAGFNRKGGGRHLTLNLLPLLDIGTVEFRLWAGTKDLKKLKFYALLCSQMVTKAIRAKKVRIFTKVKTSASRAKQLEYLWQFLNCLNMKECYPYAKTLYRVEPRGYTWK